MSTLVPCSSCGAHVKHDESRCPFCSTRLRDRSGALARTGVAILMGLSVGGLGACSKALYGMPDASQIPEPKEAQPPVQPADGADGPDGPAPTDTPAGAEEGGEAPAPEGDGAGEPALVAEPSPAPVPES